MACNIRNAPYSTQASLKPKLFYLLIGKRDTALGSPCGVGLIASGTLRCTKLTEIGYRKAPTIERLRGKTKALTMDITVRVGVWLACTHE